MKILITLFATLLMIVTSAFGQVLKDTVVDIDGNVYHTIKIGSQVWMLENLKVTHFRNGDSIPYVTSETEWDQLITAACCDYNNDTLISEIYGRLYNRYAAVDEREICPLGWHVPSYEDWMTLTEYLGGETLAGGKLKEKDTTHWKYPNSGATNRSGFTALPGGSRGWQPSFDWIGDHGYWWSSTQYTSMDYYSTGIGWVWKMSNEDEIFEKFGSYDLNGFSVRCIKN
jgi:uncharacterized protein (TIGR02145 family)